MPKKQKNEEKKIKSQSRHSKRRERKKKFKKKNVQSRQLVTDLHVSGNGSFPPFETAGMEKTTKKKLPKMKVGHFGKKISKGVRLENIFGNRVKKKNSRNVVVALPVPLLAQND